MEHATMPISKHSISSKNNNIQTMIDEYISKQNLFDPHKNSPNKFLDKLEHRMKSYYNDMYKTFIRHKK